MKTIKVQDLVDEPDIFKRTLDKRDIEIERLREQAERDRAAINATYLVQRVDDNQLVKDAKIALTTSMWAKAQLSILADMLDDRGERWFANEIRRVKDGIKMMPDANSKEVKP